MSAHLCPARLAFFPCLLATVLAACSAPLDRPLSEGPASLPHLPRSAGGRLGAFAGAEPEARGWVRVRDLFWVQGVDATTWNSGQVWDGARWLRQDQAGPLPRSAAEGYLLRTDHVSLRTNASWAQAETLAREAEHHVLRLFDAYGDALDLRFPSAPLRVLAHRHRRDFAQALQRVAPGHAGWGAFYDGLTGVVHLSTEPAPAGALPLVADLRHEMTHQMLDLSGPRNRRARGANPWLWEGFAVHCEALGDGEGEDTARPRRERFERRLARGEVTPLTRLLRMKTRELQGRHYDQLEQLLFFLMEDGVPGSRHATLETLHGMLQGSASPTAFERRLGLSAAALDRAWQAR